MKSEKGVITVEGKSVEISNLSKVLYPAAGFTKGDVIKYYIEIAPFLLPHLKGRALTMKRYPDGVQGFFFYEKRCPPHRPKWVRTADIQSRSDKETRAFCVLDNLPSLVWAANLADLELHTSLALAKTPDLPTMMVYDLDPGEGAGLKNCARVALWLREKLTAWKLAAWIKTSGSKGLQLYVPLNSPRVSFAETKSFSHALGGTVAAEHPRDVVTNMRKELRKKKVLIDWSQNERHKTTVCVYSLRATEDPSVSMPLQWKEVESLAGGANPRQCRFSPAQAVARATRLGDLFADVLTKKQILPKQ